LRRQQEQLWASRKQQMDEKLDSIRKLVAQLDETLAEGKDIEHAAKSLEHYEQTAVIGGKLDLFTSDLTARIDSFRQSSQRLLALLGEETTNNDPTL
jgi:hypothetical protein